MQCTGDTNIVQTDNLHPDVQQTSPDTTSSDVSANIENIEQWRRSKDALYRIFTAEDPRELNEFVLGLVASGQNGTSLGLLRRLYYTHMDLRCQQFMDCLESQILSSELTINTPKHRLVCHCLILMATAVEPEFLSYIVLHSYNREQLRHFINVILQSEIRRMLQGGFDRLQSYTQPTESDVPFQIESFVSNARHLYVIHCLPKHPSVVV